MDSPFTTIGDEALEARIVAWVLGEASAFEAAELERLCDERPELMIFKRRMLALHGMLAEAEKPQFGETWKLPPVKRVDLVNTIDPTPHEIDHTEIRVHRSAMHTFLAIAACLIITVIILGLSAPMVIRQRKKSDVTEARSRKMQMELAALEAESMQPLRTELPPELIEGTPKPIILPNSESPVGGFAGSGSLRNDVSQLAKNEKKRNRSASRSNAPPTLSAAPSSSNFSIPEPADIAMNSDAKADAFSDESLSTSRLTARQALDKKGSGTLSMPSESAEAIPSEQSLAMGNRSGDGTVKPGNGAATLDDAGRIAGEKVSEKQELAKDADMPVLGARFSSDEKSDLEAQSSLARNEELGGAHTYTGKTTVVGGSLGHGRASGYGGGGAPASPSAPRAGQSLGSDVNGPVSRDADRSGALAAADSAWDAEDNLRKKQKALEEINERSAMVANLGEVKLKAEATLEADPSNVKARQVLNMLSELEKEAKQKKSKSSLTDLASEIPAVEEPYSTFSLNISDASFRIAQAALAKGERPDPAGIKVEQFYNAVDYGDPAPAAGEPVSCAIEQAAHPVIPGRNLVRVALKTAAAGRSAAQPLLLTLLVDQSGSMVREDRRTAMNKALAGLSELLTGNDLVTVIGFSRTPRLLADGITGDKAGKLAELINIEASEGGTNLEEAIKLGEQMADRRKLAGAQNRIVLFTDGAANLGNADPERLAEKVKQLRQKGIAFDIAGIAAEDLNDELLGELARNGNGRYYIVGKGGDDNFAKQLAGAFRPAAENVKVQVRFNPERVGRYKLIGFEKDRLTTEDFRNDKVDAAELAAEEAGVAIYQVETLPEGHGELGEVSVRFRDTAKNEMVERSWTISHDSGASAIDRATPSMQLATLAMLAGEKLKGGPLAEAIDFKQLTAPAANVKQFYGNTGRVAEVLRMVDALK